MQLIRKWNFGPFGWAIAVFHELLGEKWPRDILGALYFDTLSLLHKQW